MAIRTICLIRHGHYELKKGHLVDGLTPTGVEQAQLAARRCSLLPITAIHCSTLQRAIETAEIIAREFSDVPLYRSRLLRECIPCVPRNFPEVAADITVEEMTQYREQAEKAFKITKKVGIETLAYFMMGNPKENKKTILDTIRFAKKLNPNYCHFTILIPMPATPVYHMGIKEGILTGDHWQKFAAKPGKDFIPEFWIDKVPKKDLNNFLERAYKEFYLRPSYILRSTLKVRSLNEFLRKAKAGLKIFKLL